MVFNIRGFNTGDYTFLCCSCCDYLINTCNWQVDDDICISLEMYLFTEKSCQNRYTTVNVEDIWARTTQEIFSLLYIKILPATMEWLRVDVKYKNICLCKLRINKLLGLYSYPCDTKFLGVPCSDGNFWLDVAACKFPFVKIKHVIFHTWDAFS